MNMALWIGQGFLAFAFIAAGALKVFAYERYKAMTEKNGPTGVTRELANIIGIAEMAGGVGVILPMASNVMPWLTALAATGLAIIMLLAIGFHVRRHESPATPAVLFLLAAFVAVGRLSYGT